MAGPIQSIFGVHEQALLLRARRAEVLAANLANADTPAFKARDFDFSAALAGAAGQAPAIDRTDARHLGAGSATRPQLAYRNPFQPARDGNTVETDLEFSRFAENSVGYQASLMFINGRIASLRAAIGGR
jgi:flagellar basal-body rod protein FlgB